MPEFDPAIRPADDEVVANDSVGDIDEPLPGGAGRGLAGIAEGHAPVAIDNQISFDHDLPGAHPDEDRGAPTAVVSFDVPETIVADGPVLEGHHVDGGDVIAAV